MSVVIPTMNEEKTIGDVIDGLRYLSPMEIIVVDTDSKDRTRQIAEEKGARVIQEPRRGYGIAYKTGISNCKGELILCLDGDGTYPSEIVGTLIELLKINNVDFISCDRISLGKPSLLNAGMSLPITIYAFLNELSNEILSWSSFR